MPDQNSAAHAASHASRPACLLLPDLGDLFRFHPRCNAATVVEYLRHVGHAGAVYWLSSTDPDAPLQDALPVSQYPLQVLTPEWAFAEAEYEQLEGFLRLYPQGRERLRQVQQAQMALSEVLTAPLTWAQLWSPAVQNAVQHYHHTRATALDEGPGTLWRERRLTTLTELLQAQLLQADVLQTEVRPDKQIVAIVPLDDLYDLSERLHLAPPPLEGFEVGEASRLRALADRAWRLAEEDDLNTLLEALLREEGDRLTPKPELDMAAAGIYMAVGQLDPALTLLERAAHALQDHHPRSLAGMTLARLGQVRDALGQRELAQRTYRAVLALSYAPAVALHTAERGLKEPFVLELES